MSADIFEETFQMCCQETLEMFNIGKLFKDLNCFRKSEEENDNKNDSNVEDDLSLKDENLETEVLITNVTKIN